MIRYINIDKERHQAHLRWSDGELKQGLKQYFLEKYSNKNKKAMCIETNLL